MSFGDRAASSGLDLPDYGGRELGAVIPAALASVGVADVVTGRDARADQQTIGVPDAQHVVVVLVDGLGWHQLEARRGHAPFLRSLADARLTTGYPTTTAASLALFGTGAGPGRTGLTGYSARNPRTGELANLISWEGAYDALEWQTQPSLLEEAARAGVTVTTIGAKRFAGSGLTNAVLRGGEFVGIDNLAERVDVALARAARPGVTYLYWGEIDAEGHTYGWQSGEWTAALEDADRELGRLARQLPSRSAVVITADHGMVDVTGAPRWDIAQTPVLADGVECVAGEPRALHLYGPEPDQIVARWQEALGEHAVVGGRDDAVASGIFGEVDAEVASRIGDVVVAMTGCATVVDSRVQSDRSRALIGVHGSLTPEELYVPVLVAAG